MADFTAVAKTTAVVSSSTGQYVAPTASPVAPVEVDMVSQENDAEKFFADRHIELLLWLMNLELRLPPYGSK